MFSWFKRDNTLQEALIRSYESQIGFLKSQLEYEQGKNDDFLNLIHRQAGLVKDSIKEADSSELQPLPGRKSWTQTQRELEGKYASEKSKLVEEHLKYIADNESIIAGDYIPPGDDKRTN
jgi:hypothetical protein